MEKNKTTELDLALTAEEKSVLAETVGPNHDDRYNPTFEKAKDYRAAKIFAKVITYGFLTLFALFMLLPFVFMITVSLKSPIEYQREVSQTLTLLTKNPTLVNFRV